MTLEDAIVDTGVTGLSLPKSLIEQLSLTPVRSRRAQTTNGIITRDVRYTVLEREGTIEVADLLAGLPVLVGHMVLEYLYNLSHDDEWIGDQL